MDAFTLQHSHAIVRPLADQLPPVSSPPRVSFGGSNFAGPYLAASGAGGCQRSTFGAVAWGHRPEAGQGSFNSGCLRKSAADEFSTSSRPYPFAATAALALGASAAASRWSWRHKSGCRRGRKRVPLVARHSAKLPAKIAKFYDASTGIWLDIWGEHLHHGYYPEGFKGSLEEHQQAQIDMIEKVLAWSEVPEPGAEGAPKSVVDVGCGVGGSSRHLQRKYGGTTEGITLSPEQVAIAEALSQESGQADVCHFQVANALSMPFPDNSFDLVWSLESGEHIPQKEVFMSEMYRVCKPGGRVILVTWVHRDLPEESKGQLRKREQTLLNTISWAYHLPAWCSIADYAKIAADHLGLSDVKTADWTKYITPFWGAVIRTALQPRGWVALYKGGWRTVRGAMVMPLMRLGYMTGTIKFGLLTYKKPTDSGGEAQSSSSQAKSGVSTSALPTYGRWKASPARGWITSRMRSGRNNARVRCFSGEGTASTPEPVSQQSPFLREGPVNAFRTVWDFSRPHTLIGSFISVVAVHAFAAVPIALAKGPSQVLPVISTSTFLALVPALLINIYITGLNQVFDVEIDRVNKPYLPIPAGRLTRREAWQVCVACLGMAVAWSWSHLRARSLALHLTLASSAILGTIYSAPPIRLKRFPFFAAFCIVVVRGIIVNLGFYWFAMQGLASSGLVASPLDARGGVSAVFFGVFGLVIALMKDIPDVLGDRMEGIRSLSVRLGPKRVLRLATAVLRTLLTSCAGGFVYCSGRAFLSGRPLVALLRIALALVACSALNFLAGRHRTVDPETPKTVYDFYMDVWRVFYISYLCLPLAV